MIVRDLLPLLSGPKHSKARMIVRGMQALPWLAGFFDMEIHAKVDRQAETITVTTEGDSLTLTFAQLENGNVQITQ